MLNCESEAHQERNSKVELRNVSSVDLMLDEKYKDEALMFPARHIIYSVSCLA